MKTPTKPRWIIIPSGKRHYRLLDQETGRIFGRFATEHEARAFADGLAHAPGQRVAGDGQLPVRGGTLGRKIPG